MPAAVPLILGAAAYTGVSAAIGGALFTAIAGSTIGAVAATAIGTGVLSAGISAAQGASLGDAIKNGVLSGATSFVGGTIGSYISSGSSAVSAAISEDAAFIAADAAQMAKQGLSQNQIAYNLAASGVNAGTAEAASVAAILNGGENAAEIIDSVLWSMPTGSAATAKSLFVDPATQAQYANLGIEPPVAGAKPTYNYGADKWTWEAPDGTLYNQAGQVLETGDGGALRAVSPVGDNTLIAKPAGFSEGSAANGVKTYIDPATGTSINAYTGEVVEYGTGSAEYAAQHPELYAPAAPAAPEMISQPTGTNIGTFDGKPAFINPENGQVIDAYTGDILKQAQVVEQVAGGAQVTPGLERIAQPPGSAIGTGVNGELVYIDPATNTQMSAYTGEIVSQGSGQSMVFGQTDVPAWMPSGTVQTYTSGGELGYQMPGDATVYSANGSVLEAPQPAYTPPVEVAPAPAPVAPQPVEVAPPQIAQPVDTPRIPPWAPEGTVAVETPNGPGFRMPGDNVVYDSTGSVIEVQQPNVPVAEAPVSQPVTEAPVSQPIAEAPVAPAPVAPAPAPQSVPYRMADGSVVYQTPSGIYTAEGGLVHPNPDWVNWMGAQTEAEYLAQQVAQAPVSTPVPENTIPVTLPDGSVGAYDPATNTVYDGSGNTVATSNPVPGPGSETAGTNVEMSGVPRDAVNWRPLPEGVSLPAGTQPATPDQYTGYKWNDALDTYTAPSGAFYDQASNTWVMPTPISELPEVVITAPRPEIVPTLPEVVVTAPSGMGGAIGEAVGAGLGGVITTPVAPPAAPPAPPVQQPVAPEPAQEQPVDRDPNPNAVITPGTGTNPVANVDITGGTGTTPGTGTPGTGVPGIGTPGTGVPGIGPGPVAPPPPNVTPPPNVAPPEPPFNPEQPPTPAPTPPVIEPPAEIIPPETTPPGGNYSDVGGAIGAVIGAPGVTPPPATRRPYGPIPPTEWGTVGGLVNPGLNPGLINAQQFYDTTSPVQGQYYWGNHPYQPGPVFDPLLYNNVPGAAAQPWGLQQMYTPVDLNAVLARYGVAGPIAPPKY